MAHGPFGGPLDARSRVLSKGMVYLDTNVLMALLCPEPESEWVMGWFAKSDSLELVSSPWNRTELASALAIKRRTKQLGVKEVTAALAKGLAILDTTRCEMVETVDFDDAALLCAQATTNVRAPDALHLCLAQRVGCTTLATMDVDMQKVAKKMGFKLVNFTKRN